MRNQNVLRSRSIRGCAAAVGLALASAAFADDSSCIISGSTNSTPSSVACSVATRFDTDAYPIPSAATALEARCRTWAESLGCGIDFLTLWGFILTIR